MLSRKTPEANLENKRGAWKAIGFVASLSLLLSALAWTSYDVAITRAIDFEADLLEDEEIPVNVVQPPPPPPPPQQTTVIEIVDDEEEIEEELEIEDIELDEDTEIEFRLSASLKVYQQLSIARLWPNITPMRALGAGSTTPKHLVRSATASFRSQHSMKTNTA